MMNRTSDTNTASIYATISEIDAIIANHIAPHTPGLALAVLQNDAVIHANTYGLANLEWDIPVTTDTVFKFASASKMLTAIGIMRLWERGAILPDDPITEYLPYYHTAGHEVTIRHLLTHTSGISDYVNQADYWTHHCQRPITAREIANISASMPFRFKPGTRHAYSNTNYVLLGLIIEAASGMTYGNFMEKTIFEPLGMIQTKHLDQDAIVPKFATGYMAAAGNSFVRAPFIHISQAYAAGSLITSLDDMITFFRAFNANQIVAPRTYSAMVQDTVLENGKNTGYGFGWGLSEYEGNAIIWHRGGMYGFRSFIGRMPDEDLSIVLLSNAAGRITADDLSIKIFRHLLGLAPVKHRAFIVIGEGLRKAMGIFHGSNGGIMVRADAESHITLQRGEEESRLVPISRSVFHVADRPEHVYTFSDEVGQGYNTVTYTFPLMVEPVVYHRVGISNAFNE